MGYLHTFKSLKAENKVYFFNYNKDPFFFGIYRKIALLICPLIIRLNPSLISFISLILGFAGLIGSVFYEIKINYIMYFFFLSFILDFSDGLIARYTNKSSFFGRFIDGLFDTLVFGFIHITFLNYLIALEDYLFNINFYYLAILLLPIQHLILDRFSALARWCNKLNDNDDIQPYVRNLYLQKFTFFSFDLQQLCMLFLFFSNFINEKLMIEIFFIVSFLTSFVTIILYIYLSRKFFLKTSNPKRNDD